MDPSSERLTSSWVLGKGKHETKNQGTSIVRGRQGALAAGQEFGFGAHTYESN